MVSTPSLLNLLFARAARTPPRSSAGWNARRDRYGRASVRRETTRGPWSRACRAWRASILRRPAATCRAPPRRSRPRSAISSKRRATGISTSIIVLLPMPVLPRCPTASTPAAKMLAQCPRHPSHCAADAFAMPFSSEKNNGPDDPPTVDSIFIAARSSAGPNASPSICARVAISASMPRSRLKMWSPSPICWSSSAISSVFATSVACAASMHAMTVFPFMSESSFRRRGNIRGCARAARRRPTAPD